MKISDRVQAASANGTSKSQLHKARTKLHKIHASR